MTVDRAFYRPGQQRGGMYYVMVATPVPGGYVLTKWGPRHKRPSAALTCALAYLDRFKRSCVMKHGCNMPVWDSHDKIWTEVSHG